MLDLGFGFEVDFLPVGSGDKSGDAIAIRYGYQSIGYTTMVVDGGTKESGEALVNHIQTYYKIDRVDYVVNTHPDMDHASGLSVVLENLDVGQLWMHRPWEHAEYIRHMFKDGRITDNSLAERTKEGLKAAWALEETANSNGIPIYEPFQGAQIGSFAVLSPDQEWYRSLLCDFRNTPEAKTEQSKVLGSLLLGKAIQTARGWVEEKFHIETLSENVFTSAENESSVVLFANFNGHGILLTGDCGVQALGAAAGYAEGYGVSLPGALKFIQVPHHGSRHNVNPSTLNRVLGPIGSTSGMLAFVSASKDSEVHPRRIVSNAFKRRGARPFSTKGETLRHSQNMPAREGWGPAAELPFYEQVEDYAEEKAYA